MKQAIVACVATAVVLVGTVGDARAQDSGLAFGLKGGLNLASFNGSDASFGDASPKNRTGFTGGAFVVIPITSSFLIQPEVLYSQKGGRYTGEGDELLIELDYVEVPVLLKVRFGSGGTRPSLFAGPAVAFKVSAKTRFDGEEEDIDTVKDTDFGIVFGAGLDLVTDRGTFMIDGRYTLGVTNIVDDEDNPDFKNGVLSFSVGYAF